jgi:DNA-binding winged helix-turn-helix (wHTH) protein
MSKRQKHLYEFGRFTLDPAKRLLLRGGEPVLLQPKTFDTLLLLIERRGEVLEKEDLIRRLWLDTFVEESNLSQNVYVLRKALGRDEGGSEYIRTVPKRGYQFVANVQERSDAPQEEGSRPCAATGRRR